MRPTHKLLTVLGLAFGLSVTVGNTIGAGIVRTPGEVAARLPSFWLFIGVWVAGGLYALLGANVIAELGAMTPQSGGQYVFVRRALGDYAGFIVGWSDWISTCGTTAAVAIAIGEYAVALFPSLRAMQMVALLTVTLLTLVQWIGVRAGAKFQNVTSALKAVVLLALVAACLLIGGRNPAAESFQMASEVPLWIAFILALQAVIFTYDGWTAVVYFSGEVKNPGRDIPRAMFGGLFAIIAIYLLLNIAFVRVVPLATLAGENLAAGTVAQFIFGPRGDTFVRTMMLVSLISAVSSNVLMAPRVVFAMAGDGMFWRGAREVNKGGTPDLALLISSSLAALFIATGTFNGVIAKLSFFFVANYALSFVSLFVLRRREPAAERPFRAIGHPYTTVLAILASVVFLGGAVAGDPANSMWSLGILAASVPAFWVMKMTSLRETPATKNETPG